VCYGNKQVALRGKDFVRLLEKMGFVVVRINGSHHRMRHEDGRVAKKMMICQKD
jgi:predicted RNA binding protein YcfA (HicA-like mRNA interferase family)